MRYKYYQPNKKDIKNTHGDCVIRSFTKALNLEWLEVYDELCAIARETQDLPNGKVPYQKFLKNHDFTYYGISNAKGAKRPTVESFAKSHNNGTYVLVLANHLVTVVDGYYYDTWDSKNKSLYGYWERS